jgi:hypothetical protein
MGAADRHTLRARCYSLAARGLINCSRDAASLNRMAEDGYRGRIGI